MPFEFILIILVIIYLRKSLNTKNTLPEWHQRLTRLLYASIALMIVQLVVLKSERAGTWIAIIFLAALLYTIYKKEVFKTARFLLTAIVPYLLISFLQEIIKLVSQSFYTAWNNWFNAIEVFAFIWGIGTWIVMRKQQSELSKAREKALLEEKNNKIITAMKAELEVQVAERTAELRTQKEELEITLSELKSTQAQLIQSEKMASLGELTAGIAHEIQNPLNFVTNFSEVNDELIEEMKRELAIGNVQLANELADDIKQNLEKINHHGKRADAIVKSMLQHSRKNSGQKEVTDLNALCDEYLRLSYHGMRAKDKTFNAHFKTDFDNSIQKINLVSQNIGRALLNFFNNAFYAVNEKKKHAENTYQPLVSVSTKKLNNTIEIRIEDNGNGIPQNIIDKIFQPFFTTKPTGQGTGLGLSLSYDIITKEHGGTIKAESKVDVANSGLSGKENPDNLGKGEGSTFVIHLPIK